MMKPSNQVNKSVSNEAAKAERKLLAEKYQEAYQLFTVAREQVNKAQRAMRSAEREKLRYAQLMFEIDQITLFADSGK